MLSPWKAGRKAHVLLSRLEEYHSFNVKVVPS